MWVFYGFIGLVAAVGLGVYLWARLTVERAHAHGTRPPTFMEKVRRFVQHQPQGQPVSRRRQARKDARRGEWAARVTRIRGLLARPQETAPAPLVVDEPEPDPEPAEEPAESEHLDLTESPTDEEWAAELRKQMDAAAVPGPNDHLRRPWGIDDKTGSWSADMTEKMTRDGQMPPADAFMGGANSA